MKRHWTFSYLAKPFKWWNTFYLTKIRKKLINQCPATIDRSPSIGRKRNYRSNLIIPGFIPQIFSKRWKTLNNCQKSNGKYGNISETDKLVVVRLENGDDDNHSNYRYDFFPQRNGGSAQFGFNIFFFIDMLVFQPSTAPWSTLSPLRVHLSARHARTWMFL